MSVYSQAVISDDGQYRYELIRRWGDDPMLEFIMLNPSTADADTDDPTIRRCLGFAKSWGNGGLLVRNLYAYRATDPRQLKFVDDPFGPLNDDYLRNNIAHLTIVAWGAHPMALSSRWLQAGRLRRPNGLWCLGMTANGSPRHPLYVKGSATPIAWEGYR